MNKLTIFIKKYKILLIVVLVILGFSIAVIILVSIIPLSILLYKKVRDYLIYKRRPESVDVASKEELIKPYYNEELEELYK